MTSVAHKFAKKAVENNVVVDNIQNEKKIIFD